ncbi:MAG: archease [Thaumarchaeota archaeon]|nr:archease [Nitrososphaerota archaeon]
MKRPAYRFLPDIALADVAFAARGDSPDMLFEACAMALTEVMVDRRSVRPTVEKVVSIKTEDIDGLLYDFLTELIVIKDVDSLLFRTFEPRVSRDRRSLVCKMMGEPIERQRNRLRNDVKAVTMHLFGVRNEGELWKATVVLDI